MRSKAKINDACPASTRFAESCCLRQRTKRPLVSVRRPWPANSWLGWIRRPGGWRDTSGGSGIHRSALCQRAELMPRELSLLVMRVGRALGRFQRERGIILSRPVASNRPLQSYSVDTDFAAVVNSQMLDESMQEPTVDGTGCP